MFKKSMLAVLVAASLGTAGYIPTAAVAAERLVVVAPPAPRHEVVPAPRRGYTWAPGYWDWRGKRHVWVAGNWARNRPGYVYAEPRWVEQDNRWRLERGHWRRGDRDGDGIPNRRDAHPNDPTRR